MLFQVLLARQLLQLLLTVLARSILVRFFFDSSVLFCKQREDSSECDVMEE